VHKPWDTQGIDGVVKFLRKFWNLAAPRPPKGETEPPAVSEDPATDNELKIVHKTIKKVTEDIERLSFNTAISAFMICLNELTPLLGRGAGGEATTGLKRGVLDPLVRLLAPFAPHITEEIWQNILGHETSVHLAGFPTWEEKYVVEDTYDYPVSINGKTRAKITLPLSLSKEEVEKAVLAHDAVTKWLDGGPVKKVIVVPGRIVNVVV
jgi:leucyl-tRNA synthetase